MSKRDEEVLFEFDAPDWGDGASFPVTLITYPRAARTCTPDRQWARGRTRRPRPSWYKRWLGVTRRSWGPRESTIP